jgi:hypothetical protein
MDRAIVGDGGGPFLSLSLSLSPPVAKLNRPAIEAEKEEEEEEEEAGGEEELVNPEAVRAATFVLLLERGIADVRCEERLV